MTKEKLLASLRGKLSPIKNLLAMQREYDKLCSQKCNFADSFRKGRLSVMIEKEKLTAEDSMAKIILIIEELEQLN
jgi:hypothetical protein